MIRRFMKWITSRKENHTTQIHDAVFEYLNSIDGVNVYRI